MKIAIKINTKAQLSDFILYCLERGIDVECVCWNGIEYDDYAYFIGSDTRCLHKCKKSTLIECGFDIAILEFRLEKDDSISMYIMTKYDDIQN